MGLSENMLQGINAEPVRDDFCDDTEALLAKAESMGMRMNNAGVLVPMEVVSAQVLCLNRQPTKAIPIQGVNVEDDDDIPPLTGDVAGPNGSQGERGSEKADFDTEEQLGAVKRHLARVITKHLFWLHG